MQVTVEFAKPAFNGSVSEKRDGCIAVIHCSLSQRGKCPNDRVQAICTVKIGLKVSVVLFEVAYLAIIIVADFFHARHTEPPDS